MRFHVSNTLLAILILAWVGLVLSVISWSCSSPINVAVKAQNYNCENKIDNQDGTITLEKCIQTNEHERINQDAKDAPDNITSMQMHAREN